MPFVELGRGDFGLLLLGLLAEREMYGYELVGALRERSNAVLDLPEGTVYPALRRLERQGLIRGHWVERGDGPRRRYYRLTQDGERALASGRAAWRRFVAASDAVLGS
jgi:PadR family transcriptional regulator, regulatory protein PadR